MSELDPVSGFEPFETGDEYGARLGPVYKKTMPSKTLLGFRVLTQHLNPNNFCHGGALATFADLAMMAVESELPNGHAHYPTRNLNVDYIAPIPLGAWVEMNVDLLRVTRNTIYLHAVMKVAGKTAVRCTANHHVMS